MLTSRRLLYLKTLLRLGWENLIRVGWYRIRIRMGLHPVQQLAPEDDPGDTFFHPVGDLGGSFPDAVSTWAETSLAFGWLERDLCNQPPDFLADCLTSLPAANADMPWWRTTPEIEIKRIWEFSRMDWALAFAQRARRGNAESLTRLNKWLAHWVLQNPQYMGPNWQCGQEASLRVLHLWVSAKILQQHKITSPRLQWLLRSHLRRIAPTIDYAIGQANNHAISEAGALFVGGLYLKHAGDENGTRWAHMGRQLLETSVDSLFFEDGGFSLGSTNYHRTVLDVLSIVEVARRQYGADAFTQAFTQRLGEAVFWLRNMVEVETGDTPNIGPHDGGRLLRLVETPLRDYRPTLSTAAALFCDIDMGQGDAGSCDLLKWLEIEAPTRKPPRLLDFFAPQSGFAVARQSGWTAVLRYPQERFRPGQADGLHLDVWHGCRNILRDAGTFSYQADPDTELEFSGSRGHNTVRFDNKEPMQKVGTFLFANWQRKFGEFLHRETSRDVCFGASLMNHDKTTHRRRVSISDQGLHVRDDVAGFSKSAVIRWRLFPADWQLEGTTISCSDYRITISANTEIASISLTRGWESRHYLEKLPIPVLEIEIEKPGSLTSLLQMIER